ncbi:MAG: molecular chaperone HtpG [Ruminococcaceae bacterium]|nr:molecular chaperone HtpG [Oscillospiraceae bacterium]
MRKKAFKAESKRLLELMINSIYTHKEIFLRELISNASDAIDKLYYRSLKDGISGLAREDFAIDIAFDEDARTLTISDNGIGMTAEELETNLGTIAKSGTLGFRGETEGEENEDIDVIGQFGVGFYSAFMVSDHITVVSRAYGADTANLWESDGVDGYTIQPCEKDGHGSVITLHIKPSGDEEDYDRFLDQYQLQQLVRKYSDYIRYPIRMDIKKNRPIEGSDGEYEDYIENETLNSMIPIWKRSKSEVSDEDYARFYRDKFADFKDPLKVIRMSTEGSATFNALLFVPSQTPFNYYSKEYEKGLKLYASGVLITECCAELLPDCFSFVKGLVDSQDLSLNISRELLQHDRQLRLIAGQIEKKIKNELKSMLNNDREKYTELFRNFGLQMKYGIYSSFGQKKDLLGDLLLYRSSAGDDMTTLSEYCGRMRENQKYIYFASGDSAERIAALPQCERLIDLGYEIIYLTDDIDEFVLRSIGTWEEKEFRSVSGDDLGIDEDETGKKEAAEAQEQNKDMLESVCSALDGKVTKVIASHRLKSHPVCLSTEGAISLEMEKVLNAVPGAGETIKASRVLEINTSHPIFAKLSALHEAGSTDKLNTCARLLYGQALLIEGLPLEDPVEFARLMSEMMAES